LASTSQLSKPRTSKPPREISKAGNEAPKRSVTVKQSNSTDSIATQRPKDGTTEVKMLARAHAVAAVAALVAVMEDAAASASARIAAAGALLQWGFGKAPAIPGTAARAELLKTIERGGDPQLIRLTWASPDAAHDNRDQSEKPQPEEPSA
jgi:hypothetical protein